MAENNNNNITIFKGITASIATVFGEAGVLLKRAFAFDNPGWTPEGFIYAWGTAEDIVDGDNHNFVYTQSATPSAGDAVWQSDDGYGTVVSIIEEEYFANSKITILTPEDKEYLKSKTAYVLKDNPTQDSRMSAKQIKAKLYEGILQLFDWLVATQTELNDVDSDIYNALSNAYTKEEVDLIKDRINSEISRLRGEIIRKISELNDVDSDIYNALSNVYTKEEVDLIKNSLERTISRLWDDMIYEIEFGVNRDDYLQFEAITNNEYIVFAIPPATQTKGGVMSRHDKTKLDNLQPTEEHNADIYAHAFIRYLIEELQREIDRLDAKGRSWGELNITHDELVALSDTERNNAIVNDIQARFPNYVRKVGDLVYTKRVTDTPEHEWEWNGINWVDNGAWLVKKATNDAYGLVKGDNNYLSIINGLIQVLKADYATNIGDTTNSYTYDDLLSKNALSQNVIDDKNNTTKVPSAKAVYDHTESAILLNDTTKQQLRGYNLGMPDLSNATDLGDGNYRIYDLNGITIDYNVFNGIWTIDGTNTSSISYNLCNIEHNTEYTLSYIAVTGTFSGSYLAFTSFAPSHDVVIIYETDQNLNKQNAFINTIQNTFRLYIGPDRTFDNFQFKLQLEKGDTATPYTVPGQIPQYKIVGENALSQNVIDDKNNTTKVPSAKAVYDHTERAIWSVKGDNYSLMTRYKHATDEDFIVHDGAEGLFTYIGDDEYIILPEKINGYNLWNMRGENFTGMFSGNTSIKGVACFGNNLTTLADAFKDMPFTSIDLRFLNTSNSIIFSRAFEGCQNLTELDLSNWDTSKVVYMNSLFNGCTALRELDLSNWDTSNAINLNSMFYRCAALRELDLSNFRTSSVTTARSMFHNCAALRELDISEFTHEVMEDITYMFYGVKDCTVYFKNQEEIDFFTQPGAAGDPHWHSSNIAIIKGA